MKQPLFFEEDTLPESLAEWIYYPGSFMLRLKQHGILASVQLLRQQWSLPTGDEGEVLDLPRRSYVLVREVLISSDHQDWMYARTVFPAKTLTGKEKQLAHLKNRSLGSILFKEPRLHRSEFSIFSLDQYHAMYQHLLKQVVFEAERVWARRSLFTIKRKSLLLTEVFLSAL